MSSPAAETSGSSGSASVTLAAATRKAPLPEISFSQPTDHEANQIELLLSDIPETNKDSENGKGSKTVDSKDGSSVVDEEFASLFAYKQLPEFIPASARISAPDGQANSAANGNSYASFGDESTTVTVNAYGSIMQITRSLGYGDSGLFCVDTDGVCDATLAQTRLDQMMQLSKSPDSGLRLIASADSRDGASFRPQKTSLEYIFNRWPRFTSEPAVHSMQGTGEHAETEQPRVTLQYFCHNGTVFQKYTLSHDPEATSAIQNSMLRIPRNFHIRTLDFVNKSSFNKADRSDNAYLYLSGPKNHSYIAVHRMTESDAKEIGIDENSYHQPDGTKAVGLVMTVFINGKSQVLHRLHLNLYIELSRETQREVEASTTVEITIAYRLQVLSSNQSWKQSFIPATALASMGKAFSETSVYAFERLRWSSHDHVDFITGRTLEHILSVCSRAVPLPSKNGECELDTTSLALTCGDLSGHRIANAATFFAFEFLIEILKYLCHKSKTERDYMFDRDRCHCLLEVSWKCRACENVKRHLHDLRLRILNTLEAHLTWVARANKMGNPDAPHRWITGKEIKAGKGHDWLLPASLTDTPFEITKTYNLHQFYAENNGVIDSIGYYERSHLDIMNDHQERSILAKRLETSLRPWLKRLYEGDMQYQYVFSRSQEDGRKSYHLADHVWICKAIKHVEALGLYRLLEYPHCLEKAIGYEEQEQHHEGKRPLYGKSEEPGKRQQSLRYQARELQRVALKRFTTWNPQSQQRMLATSRTPTESRFLFHARDTALFYAMDDGFFDRVSRTNNRRTNWNNKIDVWKETVDVQAEHEETQTLEWEKPLWYALALIISSKRKKVNKSSADETLHTAAEILLGLSSEGGLFPGLLNDNREPIVFENEQEIDKYWQGTFEIPYTLWIYGKGPLEARFEIFEERLQPKSQVKSTGQLLQPMKKRMDLVLFVNSIEKRPLADISDDWLRGLPLSLNFDSQDVFPDLHVYRRMHFNDLRDFGRVINSFLADRVRASSASPDQPAGLVIDVPKSSPNRGNDLSVNGLEGPVQSFETMRRILGTTRTVQKAKKRLIWLPRADEQTVLRCYEASSQMERDNLSAFFDRHATYENHFSDDTSEALNEWTTELHLSYFRRTDWHPTKAEIPEKNQSFIPDLSCILVDPQMMPGNDGKSTCGAKIVRSVMSFRFIGDFSDRYWTCHFLECDPVRAQYEEEYRELRPLAERLSTLGSDRAEDMRNPWGNKQPWQQRKVLELLLLDYILREILSSTEGLLSWVRDVILKKDRISNVDGIYMVSVLEMPFRVRATKPLNPLAEAVEASVESLVGNESDGLFSIAERWRFFEQVLKIMEEGLSGNLQVISSWMSREKEREAEGLRWTKNDQVLYQQVIDKLRISNQRKIRELDGLRTAIRTFRDTFTRKLDTMRSDLEYRYSENTSLFTYVTVVFLPLGFATGILSMSGTPDRPTLISMIELALVAMAITLFALANARTTGKKIVQPVITIFRSISNGSLNPLLKVLLPPLSILTNILLLLGTAIRFSFLVGFHLFISLPLIQALGPHNVKSIKNAYHSVQEASKSIENKLAAGRNQNPLKVAQRRFNAHKNRRGDVEHGEEGKASFESEMTGTQQHG